MFKVRSLPCSFNKTVYEKDRDSFNCQSSINVYHCIQNERNRSGEICIQPVWVQPKYCPEYNTGANTLDTVPCNVSIGCPNVLFLSNEVYKYPVCLNKTFADSEDVSKQGFQSLPRIFTGVSVFLFIVLAACLLVWCIRRRQKRRTYKKVLMSQPSDKLELKEPFYKTSAFHKGVEFLINGGNILCLQGRWGSGKTSTAKEIYMAVTNSASPVIIRDILSLDVSEQDKPIIMDIVLSKEMSHLEEKLLRTKIDILFQNMSSSQTNLKAFMIFILNDLGPSFQLFKFLGTLEKETKFIDLSTSYTKGDRTQIFSLHFQTFCPAENFSKVENLAIKGNDESLGYPEICALFCRCHYFQTVGPSIFCNRPLHNLKIYLVRMHCNDTNKFLMLVYMSLNQMEINVNNQNDMLFEILESCSLDPKRKETIKTKPEQIELTRTEVTKQRPEKLNRSKPYITSLMPEEFVKKDKGASVYRLQHDVIKRMVLIVFGTYHFDKLLTLSQPEELKGWFKEKRTSIAQGDIKPVLEIDELQWRQYQEKVK